MELRGVGAWGLQLGVPTTIAIKLSRAALARCNKRSDSLLSVRELPSNLSVNVTDETLSLRKVTRHKVRFGVWARTWNTRRR